MKKYLPQEIEPKWQKKWQESKLYNFDPQLKKDKFYSLVELPYTSGDLHLGHWFAFSPPDAYSRFKRMQGFNVFFPIGFDAFGLPAENAAIKRKVHPRDWTLTNIEAMKKQFKTMGTMLAWDHETITCESKYYRWNQWIFIRMFEKGLAYKGKALSNWCPVDQTVLADENIEGGRCWRCGSEVVQKEVDQWFLKITEYANRLLWGEKPQSLPAGRQVDWPISVRIGQNEWIGKKEGINITYQIDGEREKITVFTTRPDTNFGATFIALAPEHPLALKIAKQNQSVKDYIRQSGRKTDVERKENKQKTGVFTGLYAINDLTGYKMPVWVSDFVLMEFGTGALVGVPSADKRDFEFARKFNLDIKRVVVGKDSDKSEITRLDQVQEEEGVMINSGFLDGLDIHVATQKIMDYIEEKGYGKKVTSFHIHDWSISRQRYWGTPIPIIHCPKCGMVPLKDSDLPLELPLDVDFTPKGKPPLASNDEWIRVDCPKCGGEAKRDDQTLDGFFDNSWYFYRYLDPEFDKGPFDTQLAKKMLPLDVYFGGAEHTLGHTLYSRFFTRFFKDLKLVDFDEYALKRVQHGVVLGPDGNRMSKSKGNVVNPDDLVKEYGADTIRLYLSFMMPYIETTAPFSPGAIAGIYRFLRRVWELQDRLQATACLPARQGNRQQDGDLHMMHKTIQKVTDDLENLKFNTAIASLMEWINYLDPKEKISIEEYQNLILLLAPFAPHITEELWEMLNKKDSIHLQDWPKADPKYLQDLEVTIAVQVNGKVRDTLKLDRQRVEDRGWIEQKALESEKVKKFLEGKKPKKIIYVQGKILSIVI